MVSLERNGLLERLLRNCMFVFVLIISLLFPFFSSLIVVIVFKYKLNKHTIKISGLIITQSIIYHSTIDLDNSYSDQFRFKLEFKSTSNSLWINNPCG